MAILMAALWIYYEVDIDYWIHCMDQMGDAIKYEECLKDRLEMHYQNIMNAEL
jgi:hypothetical protein